MIVSLEKYSRQSSLFWNLQIVCWAIYAGIYIAVGFIIHRISMANLMGGLVSAASGFVLSLALRSFYRRIRYEFRSIVFLWWLAILSSIFISAIWFWGDLLIDSTLTNSDMLKEYLENRTIITDLSGIFRHSILMIIWSGLYFFFKIWLEWQTEKRKGDQADTLAHNAQLQILRYQLNPHFLFNSLNTIRALVDEDEKNARFMITELSEFLRYTLVRKNYTDVPLNNEIDAIRHYLTIEKIRYEDKLEVTFDVDPLAEDFPVLSFLLHPLIENSIKYGMQTSPMPLQIVIVARIIRNTLQIEILNSGHWKKYQEDLRIQNLQNNSGLENIRQRLEAAYPGRYDFDYFENDGWVHVRIEINKIFEGSHAETV
ncbi:MAG: histidine kinase [Calditrichia bacterium]